MGSVTQEEVEASWGKNMAPVVRIEFDFEHEANKTIHGRTSKICPEPFDNATIDEQDILGDIALTLSSRWISSGSCWTSEGYSDADYPATIGTLRSTTTNLSFVGAFRVDEPLIRATSFRARKNAVFFRPTHGNVSYSCTLVGVRVRD